MSTEISNIFLNGNLSEKKGTEIVLPPTNPPLARDEMSPEYFEAKMNRSLEQANVGKMKDVREAFARIRAEIKETLI